MKIIKIKVAFKDKRGEIIDLLENVAINAITMITFRQGAIRANHYHKKTVQYNYILLGNQVYYQAATDEYKILCREG